MRQFNKMNKSLTIVIAIILSLATMYLVSIIDNKYTSEIRSVGDKQTKTLGGLTDVFTATTTHSFGTGDTYRARLVETGATIIGAVNTHFTSNANLYLCNATTTGSQMGVAFATSTQCQIVFRTTPAGSWQYNLSYNRGLIIVSDGTVGMASSTVTFK